ncbi:MAG: LD-carboxypeptidase [Chloroflexi bacterium]|nr:LD-carboxypeptidase [Chloroflexota bacterium]
MPLLPPRLRPGDTIGIVSPSTHVTEELDGQFEHGVRFLESLGFRVKLGKHIRSTSWGYTASPQEKAEDIHAMFADDSVQAIICSQGGDTANACLPHLDWELIRAHPKIFLGISDISVLLNAIHHQTGLVTFHGDDVMWGFGRAPTAYDRDEFLARLVEGRVGEIPPNRERRSIRGGVGEGKLLGGNLHCLLKLAGTACFPDFSDAILFVEDIGVTPEGCDHAFQQMKQMGVFERLRGAVVGYVDGLQDDPSQMQMEDILLRITAEYDFPILKVDDFGHNCPNTTLPIGGMVRLDADERTIEIVESCVRPA